MEFWTVVEIQQLEGGVHASQAFDPPDYNNALSIYHSSIAAGAINGIPYHATYLISSKQGQKMFNIFDRRS